MDAHGYEGSAHAGKPIRGIPASPRPTGRAEHHPAVEGETQPSSDGAVILDVGSNVVKRPNAIRENARSVQIGSLPVGFNAEHDIADLPVIAHKPATDDAARVDAVGGRKKSSRVGSGPGRTAPTITDVGTDVEASPAVDGCHSHGRLGVTRGHISGGGAD